MKKKILMMLALLCAVVQGAWAQASWDEVYAMTNTTSGNWTALPEGSTTGKTIGTANTTTYYYADANLTFSNSTAGGSGLTIQGTVLAPGRNRHLHGSQCQRTDGCRCRH